MPSPWTLRALFINEASTNYEQFCKFSLKQLQIDPQMNKIRTYLFKPKNIGTVVATSSLGPIRCVLEEQQDFEWQATGGTKARGNWVNPHTGPPFTTQKIMLSSHWKNMVLVLVSVGPHWIYRAWEPGPKSVPTLKSQLSTETDTVHQSTTPRYTRIQAKHKSCACS